MNPLWIAAVLGGLAPGAGAWSDEKHEAPVAAAPAAPEAKVTLAEPFEPEQVPELDFSGKDGADDLFGGDGEDGRGGCGVTVVLEADAGMTLARVRAVGCRPERRIEFSARLPVDAPIVVRADGGRGGDGGSAFCTSRDELGRCVACFGPGDGGDGGDGGTIKIHYNRPEVLSIVNASVRAGGRGYGGLLSGSACLGSGRDGRNGRPGLIKLIQGLPALEEESAPEGRAGPDAGPATEGATDGRSLPAVPVDETFGRKLDRYEDWITENADPFVCADLPRCLARGAAAPVLITSYVTAKAGYEGANAGLATTGPGGGVVGGAVGGALGLAYGAVGGALAAAIAFIRAPFAALGLFEEED